jgi:Fe-S-cluster containining protein
MNNDKPSNLRYECQNCKKGCSQIRVDIFLPKEDRQWLCTKCFFKRGKDGKKNKSVV